MFGKCLYFDKTGYLDISKDSRFNLGTSDFSIDFWIKPITYDAEILSLGGYVGSYSSAILIATYSSKLRIDICNSDGYTFYQKYAANDLPLNTWTHVALVRSAGQIKVYFNGVSDANMNGFNTSSLRNPDIMNLIGSQGGATSRSMNAYLDEFRISNIARWTANFTPPTEPYSE